MHNMRFHCGFSFNWKTIKKWLIPILIGVLLLFSQKLNVYAFDIANYSPKSQDLVWSTIQSATFTTLSDGLQGSNFSFDSDYNVTHDLLVFPFSSGFSTQSQASTYDYSYWWYKHVDNFIVYAMTNDSIGYIPCQVEEGLILCSAKGYTITGINFRFRVINKPIANGSAYSDMNYIWIQFDPRVHTFDRISSNQDIIDNNNQNTQDIIDSQEQQTQDIIESGKVCKFIDKNNCIKDGMLNRSGDVVSSSLYCVTDFLNVISSNLSILGSATSNDYYCFYDSNKTKISCTIYNGLSGNIVIPSNASYFRSTIKYSNNLPTYSLCTNGNQAISDSQQAINDSINNSNISSSSTNGGGFFDNFSIDDSRGFSSIITAPLQFLRDLLTSSSSCSPLTFGITMSDDNISRSNNGLSLPCGEVLWSRVPSSIGLLWVTLIWGLVGYRLLIDMIKFINNSLNPEYSKEYFLDL